MVFGWSRFFEGMMQVKFQATATRRLRRSLDVAGFLVAVRKFASEEIHGLEQVEFKWQGKRYFVCVLCGVIVVS